MLHSTYLRWEITKVISYKPFWVVVLIYLLVPPLAVKLSGIQQLTGGGIGALIMLYSKFNLMLGFIPVMQVSDDFQYKTIRQNIIDGLGRSEYILSKLLYHTLIAVLIQPLILVILYISFLSPSIETISWVLVNALEIIFILSLAMLITLLTKTAGLATIALMFTYFSEFILASNINIAKPINKLIIPLTTIRNIIPLHGQPVSEMDLLGFGILLIYILLVNIISITFLNRIDL